MTNKIKALSDSIKPLPFSDEISHLAMINEKLNAAVQVADSNIKRIDREYMDAKRYMVNYRGEIDPHEMFQNELALRQIDQTGAFSVGILDKLSKLIDSPYFARIDFQIDGDSNATTHYIGRFAFSYENELLVFDWRAPISSMFYDYEVGPAEYDAPIGKVNGELTLKRQFKIKNGILEYALESSMNIGDDVLQRELSQTSDEKMKSIIATIQKEQNKIIRNEKNGTIIIQGVAGSGKTSIALHRIAFLLYRFKDKLSADNITILSPNKVFGNYISTVLPELGEEPICELSFVDIASQLEKIIEFEPDRNPLETDDTKWAERVRFKSTLNFLNQMHKYLSEIPTLIFEPTEYTFGRFMVTAEWIQERFCDYQSYPIKKRLVLISDDIHERFTSENYIQDEVPRAKMVLKSLARMLKIKNTLALYKHFYKWLKRPDLFVMPKKQTLEWSDVFPFLYLHSAFEGLNQNNLIKHLVIDEMQDYTPIQYAVINDLFPCHKTILGDFGQSVNPNHLHTLAELQKLYKGAILVELCKSYRSTYEIITFAKNIGNVEKLEPMKRHGDVPVIIHCANRQQELDKIKEKLDNFLKGDGVSLGIILKTNNAAKELHTILALNYNVQLISPESTCFTNGISITSIQMSKGLEFDDVIIPDVSSNIYCSEYDRNLLYVACTRAMHKLTLLYIQNPSPLLPK